MIGPGQRALQRSYLTRDLESKTGISDKPGLGLFETALLAQEDSVLLLEASLGLYGGGVRVLV